MIDSFSGDYRWLSNFWYFKLSGKDTTVEHLYQAMKAEDARDVELILSQPSPGEAKKAGRAIKLRDDWEEIKIPTMRECLALKFCEATSLALKLTETGDQMLVEGNTWGDRFWGVSDGVGENWLGHLLMARRAELSGC